MDIINRDDQTLDFGFFPTKKILMVFRISKTLWYYERMDGSGERENHIFQIGWYSSTITRTKFDIN